MAVNSHNSSDNGKHISERVDHKIGWFEGAWLFYHVFASSAAVVVNTLMPVEVLSNSVINRGGSSIQSLLNSAISRAELLENQEKSSTQFSSPAFESLETLAAVVSDSLFQVSYTIPSDAIVVYLSIHALRTSHLGERRLIHRCLGLLKVFQFGVYFANEEFALGSSFVINTCGMVLGAGAAFLWGQSNKA
ncbi:hypothetical protein HK100_010958 [Physocladia obscura]|uniref:Uncharacterized protein n=1 Tax=Physocladia obscura TaxID=109957 RepID=A0AAD5T228_9FUNG|nr:hypothetical protein HK100_010958 [Physocladia obscura]